MAFLQTCWEVIKEDIMDVFKEFHIQGKFEKSLNTTFISLIPKKARVMDLKDFHPIVYPSCTPLRFLMRLTYFSKKKKSRKEFVFFL